jgi:hypothetical protein
MRSSSRSLPELAGRAHTALRNGGPNEVAARDLGIDSADARALQRTASLQLGFPAAVPEPSTWTLAALGLGLMAWRARRRARPPRA